MELEREILEMICERLELEVNDFKDLDYNAPLFAAQDDEEEGLGLDSIDALELVVGIKEHFGIRLTDEDMSALKSVSSIADFVRSKKGEN